MFHFKIVIPSYNSSRWLRKTLNSIARQNYSYYDVCVIDDASTDPMQKEIIKEYEERYGWKAIYRTTNHGALANIVDGITLLSPGDNDVIITLDGDDWLFSRDVLKKLNRYYTDEEIYLTYGQFITYPRWEIGFCRPLSSTDKSIRQTEWVLSHLRTFRYALWKHINIDDLKDSKGIFIKQLGTWLSCFLWWRWPEIASNVFMIFFTFTIWTIL